MRMLWAHGMECHPDPQLFGCSPVWRIGLHPRQKAGVDSPLLQQPLEPLCMGGVVSLETSVKIILRSFRGSQLLKQKHRQKHLTWAKEKKNWTVTQWSKVLLSDGSKFCISFGNQGPRVWRKSGEAQNTRWFKSSVKFPQSVMICADVSSAGVGLLCFLKSTVNAAIYQDILEHYMFPSADKLYGDADFFFQQDLAPAHTAKGTKSWFNDHGVTVIDWSANSAWPEPHLWESMYCQEDDERHQTQQCRWPEGRYQFHYTWTVPQADCLHVTPALMQ